MVSPIIGKSRAIRNIKTLISKVAPTGENILICGGTGVGKDLVAQSLHHQSKRVGKPFVKVNWNDPLKLHKSEQADQSVLRGVGG